MFYILSQKEIKELEKEKLLSKEKKRTLEKLKVGEAISTVIPKGSPPHKKHNWYQYAKRAGIKIETFTTKSGKFIIKRIK